MKRRFFVQTTACSALAAGIPLHQTLSQVVSSGSASLLVSLQRAEWAFLVQRRSTPLHGAESFQLITSSRCAFLEEQGYQKTSTQHYFFGENEEFCFFPVMKQLPEASSHDLLLPVFRRDAHLGWQYTHTLTGYQVEAMLRTTHAMKHNGPTILQQLLLPVHRGGPNDPIGTYRTQAGKVDMVTQVKKGMITTVCKVYDAGGMVFSDTFTHR